MTKELNDRLDDIFGVPSETPRELPSTPAAIEYREKVAADAGYFQKCSRCNGSGTTPWGTCFKCRGARGKTFKTSPEARAKASDQRDARKAKLQGEIRAAWIAAFPAEFAWLEKTAPRWDLAQSMLNRVMDGGDLSPRQIEVIRNGIARDAARDADNAARNAARNAAAPQVDGAGVDRLKAAFDKAVAYNAEKGLTLKTPKITIGGVTISPAPASGKNPGALYVKADRGKTYLGKIQNGQLFASRECSDERKEQVLRFVADPADAAKVYGQTTGVCCICNATLISKWKERGIGPICAQKFGW